MSDVVSYKDNTKEEADYMHTATQSGVEAAIAKNEVDHLNAKRIQDEVEDVKDELREDEKTMMFPGVNCGFGSDGMTSGLMLGMLASGGIGWGGKCGSGHGHGCGDSCHHDTIEILRDNHDGILNLKDEMSRNALAAAVAHGNEMLVFQKELDTGRITTIESIGKIQKEMECGFREVDKQFCCLKEEMLKNELCKSNEKIEELKAIIRTNAQTAEIIAAIPAAA